MSLLSVLKTIGKDLGHLGGWIDDALKVVQPVLAITDPPIGALLLEIEQILEALPPAVKPTEQLVQAVVTGLTTIHAVRSVTIAIVSG